MLHITDEMVDRHVGPQDAQRLVEEAFVAFGRGQAAMQARMRTQTQGVKLSTLGAVIPSQGVAGAKVYTTIEGRFSFVIVIFSTDDGRPLASFDAGAITRLRTAASSVIAARRLARKNAKVLALFGAGTQGTSHAEQFAQAFDLDRILLVDPHVSSDAARDMSRRCGVPVAVCDAETAVSDADLVITASRSATPLFPGGLLKPGAFVAAIGSSLPHTRELDDEALARAAAVVVEWREQSLREAGDIVLADGGALPDGKIVELADVLTGAYEPRCRDEDIVIYKSVGVGLQDVALAGFAYRQMAAAKVLPHE